MAEGVAEVRVMADWMVAQKVVWAVTAVARAKVAAVAAVARARVVEEGVMGALVPFSVACIASRDQGFGATGRFAPEHILLRLALPIR